MVYKVTKTKAPNIGGDLPFDDYSSVGEEVNGASSFIADDGDYSYYCIHIPFTQLYPYFYSEDGSINFGLKFIGYSVSDSELTRYFFGNSYSPYVPWEFGTLSFNAQKEFNSLAAFDVTAEPGEYITAEILKDGELVYFNQYIADNDGKCRISSKLDSDGSYVLRTYSNSAGYDSTSFSYTVN